MDEYCSIVESHMLYVDKTEYGAHYELGKCADKPNKLKIFIYFIFIYHQVGFVQIHEI